MTFSAAGISASAEVVDEADSVAGGDLAEGLFGEPIGGGGVGEVGVVEHGAAGEAEARVWCGGPAWKGVWVARSRRRRWHARLTRTDAEVVEEGGRLRTCPRWIARRRRC